MRISKLLSYINAIAMALSFLGAGTLAFITAMVLKEGFHTTDAKTLWFVLGLFVFGAITNLVGCVSEIIKIKAMNKASTSRSFMNTSDWWGQ